MNASVVIASTLSQEPCRTGSAGNKPDIPVLGGSIIIQCLTGLDSLYKQHEEKEFPFEPTVSVMRPFSRGRVFIAGKITTILGGSYEEGT
jgi:hypothetical protein